MALNLVELISRRLSGPVLDQLATLLSLITPVAMSVLGKQQNDLVLDADGVTRLLTEQKQFVAGTLPAGLAGTLGIEQAPGTVTAAGNRPAGERQVPASTLGSAAQDLSTATRSTIEAAVAAEAARSGGSGMGKIIMTLVILAVLVWLAYRFLLSPA
jgi:hypothetical protein